MSPFSVLLIYVLILIKEKDYFFFLINIHFIENHISPAIIQYALRTAQRLKIDPGCKAYFTDISRILLIFESLYRLEALTDMYRTECTLK